MSLRYGLALESLLIKPAANNLIQNYMKQGAVASEWASAVSVAVGGKAGGKGPTSVGNGTNVDKIDEGLELAIKYLEKLKL